MYRAFVRRVVRRAFADIGDNRFQRHLIRFATDAVMRVHADGSTRTYRGKEELQVAYRSLGESSLEGPFELLDIWVKGWPWHTRVASRLMSSPVSGMNRIRIGREGVIEEDVFIGERMI
jgi:hypothetical protein